MSGEVAGTPTIQLGERSVRPDGSLVIRVVYVAEGVEYEVAVTDPGSADDEELLSWYFERHLRYPFLDWDRRQEAVRTLREYGMSLFTQVFDGEVGDLYRAARRRGFDDCRIEVTGSTGVHRLHWEALYDPTLDAPLATRLPITRRVDLQPARYETAGPWPTLNILVVTARPNGAQDVGYRTISRPLIDAVRQASLRVTVDLVRPGTWAALRDHLDRTREQHGSGWYHLVHFDLHGAFADYDGIMAGANGPGTTCSAAARSPSSPDAGGSCSSRRSSGTGPIPGRPSTLLGCWPNIGCRWWC
jgi:hypothetical protein